MVEIIRAERKSAVLTPSSLACLSNVATVNLTADGQGPYRTHQQITARDSVEAPSASAQPMVFLDADWLSMAPR